MPKATCVVEEDGDRCPRRIHAQLMCEMHYRRVTRYHRVGGLRPEREQRRFAECPAIEQLLNRLVVLPNYCWAWEGGKMNAGYGEIQHEGLTILTHRFAYEFWIGPIPEGLVIDHLCHNADLDCPGGICAHRRCVNPEHLEAVTIVENFRRGRERKRRQQERKMLQAL